LQTSVLFYLDKFYFVTETKFETTKIEEPVKPVVVKKEVEIKIPDKADKVTMSYDGKYLAYIQEDTLYVVNTINEAIKKVEFDKDIKVSYYKWLPDINSMFIAEKNITVKTDSLKFSNYDAEKDRKKAIEADNRGNTTLINLPDKQSEVVDIQLSPLTNMVYIKIQHNGNKTSIYSMDIMAQVEKLRLNTNIPGKILTFLHEARMAYEDSINHKIWVTGINKSITIKNLNNPVLLATDDENKLYIGQLDNGKITRIYYGLVKDTQDKWKSLELKNAVDKKDIHISVEGKVYINNNLKGAIADVASEKEYNYQGKFLQIYDKGIASISEGKLIKTSFVQKK
jgi:predicted small secreted protein